MRLVRTWYPYRLVPGTILILVFLAVEARADTIYLKNGRSLEGLVKSEDEKNVELEVAQGSVKFQKSEVSKIVKSQSDQEALRQKWEKQKQDSLDRLNEQKLAEERLPKEVDFSKNGQGITVQATLNKKVKVSLVLDTGASIIMLRKNVAKDLGFDVDKMEPDMKAHLADGREANAKRISLESIKVQDSELEKVDAAILLEDAGGQSYDGLLGMSFLGKFNFKIDQKEKKLILEKL